MAYRKADGTIEPSGFDPGLDYRVKQLEGLHKTGVDRIRELEAENKRLRTVLENTVKHPETMILDKKIKTGILPNIKHRNDCWVLDVAPKAHPASTPICLCYEHALIRAGMEMTKKNGKSRKSKNHRLKMLEAEIKKLKDELATTLLEKRTLRNYIIKYVEDNPTNEWALHFRKVLENVTM